MCVRVYICAQREVSKGCCALIALAGNARPCLISSNTPATISPGAGKVGLRSGQSIRRLRVLFFFGYEVLFHCSSNGAFIIG